MSSSSSNQLRNRSLPAILFILLSSFLLRAACSGVAMETNCNGNEDREGGGGGGGAFAKEFPSVKSKGNATLVGLFNLHTNPNECRRVSSSFASSSSSSSTSIQGRRRSPLNAAATQRMLAAVWALEWLNERDILGDGLTIGFEGFSACSDTRTALRRTISSLSSLGILDGCHNNETEEALLGYIGPADESSWNAISGLLTSLNVTHESLHVTSLEAEIQAISAVLDHLQWKQVSLIADNSKIQEQFHETVAKKGICVSESFLISKNINYTEIFPKIRQSGAQVIVFLGLDFQVSRALIESNRFPDVSDFYWLVSGPTVHPGFRLLSAIDPPSNHQRIFFVQSSRSKVPGFDEYLKTLPENVRLNEEVTEFIDSCHKIKNSAEPESVHQHGIGQNCAPILSNDVIAIAENVAKLAERFRSARNTSCALEFANTNETFDCIPFGDYLFQVPQLQSEQLNVSVMAYQIGPQRELRFVEVGLYSNNQLVLKTEDLGILHDVGGGWFRVPRFKCPSCPCINNPDRSRTALNDFWLVAPWVAGCGTIASLCALVAGAIAIFILVRLCRGDAMEGSQAFAFLLLFGIVFTCLSIVPFMLAPSPIVCNIRPIAVGLDYALMFSPILSRALMLATSDTDGLLGHVSGLVQSSLFFFMLAVQAALGIQQWILMSEYGRNLQSRFNGVECVVSIQDYALSILYVSFLLASTVIVTGLSVRNRRNYHEALFFHISSLLVVVVWAIIISLFFLLDGSWQQAVVCCGLVSVASILLIVVFIPRVFKMYRALTLDTLNSGMRSVERCTVPSLTDMTVRASNTMIYETVNHAYAPEPILVNGDGIGVKENPFPLEMEITTQIVEPETEEIKGETNGGGVVTVGPPPEIEKEEGNLQRKPPTVTHL